MPNEAEAFPINLIQCFWKDNQNRQWIGTTKGLYLLKPVQNQKDKYHFQQFTELDGLPDMSVVGILEDADKALWISTHRGLSKLYPETKIFHNYRKPNGLQADFFSENAFLKNSTGEYLYFGGLNGFNVFNPKQIKNNSIPPNAVITEIHIVRELKKEKIIPQQEKEHSVLHLFYKDKVLQIDYTALHFAAPTLNTYAVWLKGYESKWQHVDHQRSMTYTNLDPGTYFFSVKAANKDGIWEESGASLKIIVHPPWWETWWAYGSYLLIFLAMVYRLYQFQIKRKIEQAQAFQLKEMNQLKTRFFSNITHEFRTPLTLIIGPVQQIAEEVSSSFLRKRLLNVSKKCSTFAQSH